MRDLERLSIAWVIVMFVGLALVPTLIELVWLWMGA
jgi:hypothetical protein